MLRIWSVSGRGPIYTNVLAITASIFRRLCDRGATHPSVRAKHARARQLREACVSGPRQASQHRVPRPSCEVGRHSSGPGRRALGASACRTAGCGVAAAAAGCGGVGAATGAAAAAGGRRALDQVDGMALLDLVRGEGIGVLENAPRVDQPLALWRDVCVLLAGEDLLDLSDGRRRLQRQAELGLCGRLDVERERRVFLCHFLCLSLFASFPFSIFFAVFCSSRGVSLAVSRGVSLLASLASITAASAPVSGVL